MVNSLEYSTKLMITSLSSKSVLDPIFTVGAPHKTEATNVQELFWAVNEPVKLAR